MTICKKCGLRWESIEDTPEERKYRMCWKCIEEARKNGEIPPKDERKSFNDVLYEYFDKKIKEIRDDLMTENKRFSIGMLKIYVNDNKKNYCYSLQTQREAKHLCNLLNELEEENKELKQAIKKALKLLEEEVDLFSDKATEHDFNAYIELKELDNKDAYYMAISTKKAIKLLKEMIK